MWLCLYVQLQKMMDMASGRAPDWLSGARLVPGEPEELMCSKVWSDKYHLGVSKVSAMEDPESHSPISDQTLLGWGLRTNSPRNAPEIREPLKPMQSPRLHSVIYITGMAVLGSSARLR